MIRIPASSLSFAYLPFLAWITFAWMSPQQIHGDEASPWIHLFNGNDLTGWAANDYPESYSVPEKGVLKVCGIKGGSHLFYVGDDDKDDVFRNFEFETAFRAEPESNSGFFFHTSREKRKGIPWLATGYEVQLNTTKKEKRKTGSLYAIKDIFDESGLDETQWNSMRVRVEEKNVRVFLNGKLVLEYTEPETPKRPKDRKRRLISPTGGSIALQAHDPKSVYYFRNLKIRKLPSRGFDSLSALEQLYDQLDSKNQSLIEAMSKAIEIKDEEQKNLAVRTVFAEQDSQWKEFVPLMEYASRHPKKDLSLKAAVLTLKCSSDDGRDMACDLIMDHHIESKEIAHALGYMLYTGRAGNMLRKVLETNRHPLVIAHAKVALAKTLMRDPNSRSEAMRLMLEVMEQQPDLKYRDAYWGVPLPEATIGETAANMIAKMNASDATDVGKTLPEIQAIDFDGNSIDVANLKDKVYMFTFWAHWCSPCMAMVPAEIKLVDEFKNDDFELIGICGDNFDDELVEKTAKKMITWRNLRNELPDGSRISDKFGISSWPTILIVGRDGKVRYRVSGSTIKTDKEFNRYRDMIREALK